MVSGSQVSACHISNWFDAVLGAKLAPAIHRCPAYHWLAFSALQRPSSRSQRTSEAFSAAKAPAQSAHSSAAARRACLGDFFIGQAPFR